MHLANRVVIKAGTSVVSTPEGYPSLSRMAGLVENAAQLVRDGKEVLIVTSGAVGVGRQRLRKQQLLRQSVSDIITTNGAQSPQHHSNDKTVSYSSACAAAGQLGLMSLYETMFNQFDIATSQILVTAFDFTSPERRRNVQHVISQLLALGIVPLLNENDAVSANQGYQLFGKDTFSDNDSLASLVAIEMSAQLLILLTDVPGVYDRPPKEAGATLIDIFSKSTAFQVGEKSLQGRGGMGAKVDAAMFAVNGGVQAAVIAHGNDTNVIGQIMRGEKAGTMFLHNEPAVEEEEGAARKHAPNDSSSAIVAAQAREGGRQLQQLTSAERAGILLAIASAIAAQKEAILAANERDIAAAKTVVSAVNLKRLQLTDDKLDVLVAGICSIAGQEEPLGQTMSLTELAEGLLLEKVTCPIGVLLIIFESRPDCLPQIAALAIRSGNGLLLKGGKEAEHSNALLHRIVTDTIESSSGGRVGRGAVSLVSGRDSIPSLLKLDDCIDLVIPRGSNALVKFIKDNTHIPVMGHADGICHVYVDSRADAGTAERVIIDAKTDYPAACNAAETLLLHADTVSSGLADRLLRGLRSAGVTLYGGPAAIAAGLVDRPAESLACEYGDLAMAVELVSGLQSAVEHIHKYGSGHTECIVTEDAATAEAFLSSVDSACVFHNASTRFADGFRFGLGAEVGIATGKIHARGPVGIAGLLTSKWKLRSSLYAGHTVADFAGKGAPRSYTHKVIKKMY